MTWRPLIKKHLTVALALVVVCTAFAAVAVSRSRGQYGADDLTEEARSAGLIGSLFGLLAPTPAPPAAEQPTATPGYEPVGPGDRTSAGSPEFYRSLMGSIDGAAGLIASSCLFSHSGNNDPIVYPSIPGASHLHEFFGHRSTDAYSTAASLRSAPATTCNFAGDASAYWVPALYENGTRVVPDHLGAYYSAGDKQPKSVEPFPRGLKLLVKDYEAWSWYCDSEKPDATLSKQVPTCPAGQGLALQIVFPDCWDGKYLDVPDHRSHMAYAVGGGCPTTHPVGVPLLRYFVVWKGAHGPDVVLAPLSDPSSPHADFINAWDQAVLNQAVRDCIVADVKCDGRL